ncbi:MAG: hypothetical protein JRN06_05630 [Nitrososphaerota archaeon]|nr:hypothetical protein [Nitrososphaerota archaeon]MDG7024095.1 hypothetical protein [Nitrososphaerota archaeon]
MSVPADPGYNLVARIVTLLVILGPIGLIPFYQTLIRDISPAQKRDVA